MGSLEYSDGSTYTGSYKDDKKHGFGIYKWNDGKVYEGSWKEG